MNGFEHIVFVVGMAVLFVFAFVGLCFSVIKLIERYQEWRKT
jgi:hypothetical protein